MGIPMASVYEKLMVAILLAHIITQIQKMAQKS